MIPAWTLVILAEAAASKGTAFDPKAYIQTLPVEADEESDERLLDDEEDDEPKVSQDSPADTSMSAALGRVRTAAAAAVVKAEVTVEGKDLIAFRSAFGTIYLPENGPLDAKRLAGATCATTRPAPTRTGPNQPLTGKDVEQEAAIVKAIESHCKLAAAGSKPP
jgi:hypothetical protein